MPLRLSSDNREGVVLLYVLLSNLMPGMDDLVRKADLRGASRRDISHRAP